ncbi:hypothetical protein E4U43_007838, partial [Claviceps pusilla]
MFNVDWRQKNGSPTTSSTIISSKTAVAVPALFESPQITTTNALGLFDVDCALPSRLVVTSAASPLPSQFRGFHRDQEPGARSQDRDLVSEGNSLDVE